MKEGTKGSLRNLPKAPRRFQVVDENTWIGSPSVPYGVIRRLAYDERNAFFSPHNPYLRILFGEAGRRSDPWGGLTLEVNGELFHFTAGVKRWPCFHDGAGNLTSEGQQALADGMPGLLSTSCDWRWVQDEVDFTSMLNDAAIEQIARYFRNLRGVIENSVLFQSRMWAKRWNVEIKPYHHNCTTIILKQIERVSGLIVEASMPLPAFNKLYRLTGASRSKLDEERYRLTGPPRSKLDDELNYFLSLSEQEVSNILEAIAGGDDNTDWNKIAKGEISPPDWLTWDDLFIL